MNEVISKIHSKRIIIAPLNWGLGHATRCIPIIDQLLNQNNKIAIATEGQSLTLLKNQYPKLTFFELPAYDINYPTTSMVYNMATQAFKVYKAIQAEYKDAKKLSVSWRPDIILSDNRLGFRNPNVHCIYMTHQLLIPLPQPLFQYFANKIHHRFIRPFNECWIPDYEGDHCLAGIMSQAASPITKSYIGPLSRMKFAKTEKETDIIVVLSGPEPQRTILEKEISEVLKTTNYKCILVRGTDQISEVSHDASYDQVYNLIDGATLNQLILQSKLVICRSGYRSIMDLDVLKSKAILIPTPGQYEQEYLAEFLGQHKGYQIVSQVVSKRSSTKE